MLYGIYSDIHSNLPALTAVFNSMDESGVEQTLCLGDLVGYGAHPNECIDLVRSHTDTVVLGNHDSVAAGMESSRHFNQYARNVIEWTAKELTPENKDYLKNLPYVVHENDCALVHASPRSPADWVYVNSLDEAADAFDFYMDRFCFIGHTHTPIIVAMDSDGNFKVVDESEYQPLETERLLVNVGSVGQPRDRNPEACYCLFQSDTGFVKHIRVPYDIAQEQEAMRNLDFPDFLINRLEEGR